MTKCQVPVERAFAAGAAFGIEDIICQPRTIYAETFIDHEFFQSLVRKSRQERLVLEGFDLDLIEQLFWTAFSDERSERGPLCRPLVVKVGHSAFAAADLEMEVLIDGVESWL